MHDFCALVSYFLALEHNKYTQNIININALEVFQQTLNNPNYSSIDGVLFNKLQSELIQYPAGKAGNYTIPNSVTSMGTFAFQLCCKLTSVMIPDLMTSIGYGAFNACRGLKTITIPDWVTSIQENAFLGCSSLTLVTIGNSVRSIGNKAFYDCSGLKTIMIPNSVTNIGSEVFRNCSSLTSVTNLSPMPQTINSYTFYGVTIGNIPLYVPAESVEIYKAAPVWKNFKTITAYTPSAINTPSIANGIRICPDPATGSFRIEGLTTPTQVSITDINGHTVFGKIISGDESIVAGHWAKGVYLVCERENGENYQELKDKN
jgi:hypothetical protein